MKTYGLKTVVLSALVLLGAETSRAQPTASPTSFNFTYQVNSTTLPPAGKLTVTMSKATSTGYTLTASVTPFGQWLTVTSDPAAPLVLTVTVNPTGLVPGPYSGKITLGTNPATGTTDIPVALLVSNPPSSIIVTPGVGVSNYTPSVSGANPVLAFNYTTGDATAVPATTELDVASNGGTIPFTVAVESGGKTGNWLRLKVGNQAPTLTTSGVTLSGNFVPISVTIDYSTLVSLNVGPYSGKVTFTNSATNTVSAVITVSLNISAGPPTITTIFPSSVTAGLVSGRVPPVITIYGDNFFSNSSVQLTPEGAAPLPALTPVLLSRQVLQATLNPSYLTKPGNFTITVANPSTLSNPSPQESTVAFTVTDGTVPMITSVLNAASYLNSATWRGTVGLDPVPAQSLPGSSAVSPRELIAIFGQSIGPGSVLPAQASTAFPSTFPLEVTPAVAAGVSPMRYEVLFRFANYDGSIPAPYIYVPAPIIMVSSNQINAVVPVPPQESLPLAPSIDSLYALPAPNACVLVRETKGVDPTATTVSTDCFPVTFVPEVPGVFTFGGLGLGQAAVLNYDATAGYSINSAKNPAAKGSTISLYVTGMGDLTSGSNITVTDSSTPPLTAKQTFGLVVTPTPAAAALLTALGGSVDVIQNAYSVTTLDASGGAPPYTWSVVSGLPPGMILNVSGILSGTPTTVGIYTLVASLTDSAATGPVQVTYFVSVNAPTVTVTTTGLVPGVKDVVYPTTTLTATGGKGPYTWFATNLPPGLTLSPAGVLSGTPGTAAAYSPTFTATDSSVPGVPSAGTAIALNVLTSGMTLTTDTLRNGVVNVRYPTTTFRQQGGTAPVAWSAPLGLPDGFSLTPSGVLSGTPTADGTTSITVRATDNSSPPQVAEFTYTINVAAPLSITTPSLPSGIQTVAYPAIGMQAAGGTPPYTWTASGLPLGMTISPSGYLSGTPAAPFYLPLPDGAVALGAVYVANNTYRVEINGQAAVTSYAGASQGSVAGLTQINAIVPPTAPTGAAIPLIVYIGKPGSTRASQLSVTLAVK